jgi:DNA-binding NarL/FixJ family response regulator
VTDIVRVLIADDHVPTRTGVRMALERGGIAVVAEAANARDAVLAAAHDRPDVCLIDIDMPGGGIEAAAEISAAVPGTYVLMLTVSQHEQDLFDALQAGAAGYLLKDMDPAELPAAVRRAAAGEAVLPGGLTARLVEELRRRERPSTPRLQHRLKVAMTPREREVLELLGDGRSTAEIAERLRLSPVTVRRHVSAVMRKLEVSSRDELRRLLASSRSLS